MGPGTRCFLYRWVPTADLWVQNTIFNDKSAILLHPGTRWNKNFASQRQNYAQKIQDAQVTKSLVRSLIGLFVLRSNPDSKVYQHSSRNGGNLGVAWSTGSLRKTSKRHGCWGVINLLMEQARIEHFKSLYLILNMKYTKYTIAPNILSYELLIILQ